jgi:hypothetical protein
MATASLKRPRARVIERGPLPSDSADHSGFPAEDEREMRISRIAPRSDGYPERSARCRTPFGSLLLKLRLECLGKQATFALAMDVTEAAVSYWEVGQRLPGRVLFRKAVQLLVTHGASPAELVVLEDKWRDVLLLRHT